VDAAQALIPTDRETETMKEMAAPLELFPIRLTLRKIDPSCNMRRYYSLSVQPDLFGNACLVREWGRIGTRVRIRIDRHWMNWWGNCVTGMALRRTAFRSGGTCARSA
jgi:hypothetical protein